MNEIIKLLDENLKFIKHIVNKEYIRIWIESSKIYIIYLYCKTKSNKVHSRYERNFEDLPI